MTQNTELLKLALEASEVPEKLFKQAEAMHEGLIPNVNVDCQIAVSDLRKGLCAATAIREALAEQPHCAMCEDIGVDGFSCPSCEVPAQQECLCKDKCLHVGMSLCKGLPSPLAKQPAPVTGWHPMETAPKDGAEILLYSLGDIGVCYWREDEVMTDWTWGMGKAFGLPTHWMPLPAAPQQAQPQQPDDQAVDRFAAAMKDKLAKAREKGRGGWETCPPNDLSPVFVNKVVRFSKRPSPLFLETSHAPLAGSATPL